METLFRTARGEVEPADRGSALYRDLVFNRFYDTVKTSFPVFSKIVGRKVLRDLVSDFLKEDHRSPILADLSYDFAEFFRRTDHPVKERLPFLEDLLEFELAELEVFTAPDSPVDKEPFDWNSNFEITPSCKLKEFSYPVHRAEEIEPKDLLKMRGSYYMILYRDPEDHGVKRLDLTEFVYNFLRSVLIEGKTPAESFRIEDPDLEPEEVKPYLERFLGDLLRMGAIRRSKLSGSPGRSSP